MDDLMLKQKLLQQTALAKSHEEALYRVLDASRLDIAKEIACEAVGEELEEYLDDTNDTLDFDQDTFDGDFDEALLEEGM